MQSNQQEFIEKIKSEVKYRKFIERDVIDLLAKHFSNDYKKEEYTKLINNPIKIVLQFYKQYNSEYYNMIISGIKEGKIIINDSCKSYVDTSINEALIGLNGNDSDIFMLVHELAHYIDRNSNPKIIEDRYWFLSETWAFYLEKKLEQYLCSDKYEHLIFTRRNNRLFFESKMIDAISSELYYEDLYKRKGNLDEKDIDITKMKKIIKYDIPEDIVNVLLQYPLANVVSDYLISNNIVEKEEDFEKHCFEINLYELLKKSNIFSDNISNIKCSKKKN